jgi:hypothetical protein
MEQSATPRVVESYDFNEFRYDDRWCVLCLAAPAGEYAGCFNEARCEKLGH